MPTLRTNFLMLLITSLFLISCDDNEGNPGGTRVCFSFPSTDLFINQERFFDASCSQNYDSIRWYMGDGSIVSQVSHNYAYARSGEFKISVVAYKGSAKDSTTTTIKILKPAVILHTQEAIWSNVVWEEGIHEVEGFVSVVEGTLTIPPGTTIRMRPGASFQVGTQSPSGLIAEGTAAKPITFTSSLENPTPGSWNHMIVGQYKLQAKFKHCIFEYGGDGPYDGMLVGQYGASFSVDNCTFRKGMNDAIHLRDKSFFDLFQNNTIDDIQGYAIRMDPFKVPTIGANNTINNKGILLITGVIDQDLTLTKQTAPYVFNTDVTVGSTTGTTLTILPGASLAFDNAYMRVGADYNRPGKIIASGAATDSIRFVSLAATPWGGLQIGDYPAGESVFKYAHFKNVGSAGNTGAVLEVGPAPISIDNSKFSGNTFYGLDISADVTLNSFSNNVVATGTKYSMRISMEELPVVGKTNSFNTGKDVFLRDDNVTQPNTIWQNLGVAYYVPNTFLIGNLAGTASLIPEAGVTVRMKSNTAIFVGNTGPEKGTIKSIGTSALPITFTLATETSTVDYPYWQGFTMYSYIGSETAFDFTTISNAKNGLDLVGTPAGLPVVSNCLFKDITEYGIWRTSATPTLTNNTFINCGWDDIK